MNVSAVYECIYSIDMWSGCSPEGNISVFRRGARLVAAAHVPRVVQDTAALPPGEVHRHVHFGPGALLIIIIIIIIIMIAVLTLGSCRLV